MIASTGRRAGATVAAVALAGAGAFASAPLASATPAASPQACLDSIKNVRFNDANGQVLLGGFSTLKQGAWDIARPAGMYLRESASVIESGRVWFSALASNWLSASADHDAAACKGAVMTFGFSKADGSGYRNSFARGGVVGYRLDLATGKKQAPGGSLVAGLPITPKDTGEWKVRQVAVRQGGELVVKSIGDVTTTVLRASSLNGVIHGSRWAEARTKLVYNERFKVIKPAGKDQVRVYVPGKMEARAKLPRKVEASRLLTGLDTIGITGHLTTISTKGGVVGLKGQTIVLQARKGGAKGSWQTVLVEQKSTHANGYYLLQVNRAKVAGQELRLHYPSPYQSIAKSYQYLGKVR